MTRRREPVLLDAALLDRVTAEARESPRGRRNFNLHPADDHPAHRLLNAIEPGSYIAPHRHADPDKDESILVVRGRVVIAFFDDEGRETSRTTLSASGPTFGVDVPHGTFHTLWALDPGSAFFEAKAGPYRPLTPEERAPWAPAENDPGAAAWLRRLVAGDS
ncbi:MAG: WbuC family cupin fold metalloprotein [Alphaproteobacteria bacterium]